jgi:GTP-binding protein
MDTGDILFDCVQEGRRHLIARGGRGGKGNADLANPRNPNPERAEFGKPGVQRRLQFELKTLADVGLVGRPNAGKSTFLARISRAHPKVADYPFTTTQPNLGIVKPADYESFVVADIPGLIEGSHEGKGLGIRFLRHIERTRVLAVMVDSNEENPRGAADTLIDELSRYSSLLAAKPKCFILTKTDVLPPEQKHAPDGWLRMSAVTGEGVQEALVALRQLLRDSEPGSR